MLAQGGGRIINVASMTSFFGSEQIPAYAASKGAVAQLTKALSNEWAGRGVNVNAIAPGYMVTRLTADMQGKNPAQYAEITARIPMHRWGQPGGGLCHRRHPAGGRRLSGKIRIHRNFRVIPLIHAKKE